jgi:hypothetical protein
MSAHALAADNINLQVGGSANCSLTVLTFIKSVYLGEVFETRVLRLFVILNDQFKEDELDRVCSPNGAKRNAYRILVGQPEGNRPLGRPTNTWMDNIVTNMSDYRRGLDWQLDLLTTYRS